jgi:hypothetical protein
MCAGYSMRAESDSARTQSILEILSAELLVAVEVVLLVVVVHGHIMNLHLADEVAGLVCSLTNL